MKKAKFKIGQSVYWHYGSCIYFGKISKINYAETKTAVAISYLTNYEGWKALDRKTELIRCSPQPFSYIFTEHELFLSEKPCRESLKKALKKEEVDTAKYSLDEAKLYLRRLKKQLKELPKKIKEQEAEIEALEKELERLKES